MRWSLVEVLLRGMFIGLWAYASLLALQPREVVVLMGGVLTGVALGFAFGALHLRRTGVRSARRPLAFTAMVLLERPLSVCVGVILGLLVPVLWMRSDNPHERVLFASILVGLIGGLFFLVVRRIRSDRVRIIAALATATIAFGGVVYVLEHQPRFSIEIATRPLAWFTLLGIPAFYLLCLIGRLDEAEGEAAAWCGMLAVAFVLIPLTPNVPWIGALLSAAVYYFYVVQVMPRIRAFKHTVRGIGHARAGRPREALVALRQASRLQPDDAFTRSAMWEVHRSLVPNEILTDTELQRLIDPGLCLDRTAGLLATPPSAAQLAEARHLLDLVDRLDPRLRPLVRYWRAVAAAHARDFDRAADELSQLLAPNADQARRSILLPAWQLASSTHGDLVHRVAEAQLDLPGRRLEAIDVVERALESNPADESTWGLKRLLYSGLKERDLDSNFGERIDTPYVEQLGIALADDLRQFRRAAEYFAIAARTCPEEAPRLWLKAAEVCERHGAASAAQAAREQGKRAGLSAGAARLSPDAKQAFYSLVKRLGEDAAARGDLDAAIDDFQLYAESERSGIETLRTLADLFERRGDALAALHAVERALIYNPQDGDLLARKDKYHYSITPEQAGAAPHGLRQAIDDKYCVAKARQLLDLRDADAELLDWAEHLANLAVALHPDGMDARLQWARARLRLGRRDEAVRVLEDVREARPERFASSEEEAAWFAATRLLGDLYLNELDRPDLAAAAFTDYRKCSRSGADTLFKLGLAYERMGEPARAAKCFEQVSAYEGHPLHYEAAEALRRVRG